MRNGGGDCVAGACRVAAVTIAPEEDAYGAILAAAFEGRDAAEIMERDDGTVWCGDGRDYLHPPRRWPASRRCSAW